MEIASLEVHDKITTLIKLKKVSKRRYVRKESSDSRESWVLRPFHTGHF